MVYIKPFICIRPNPQYVNVVSALPYDIYTQAEAYEIVKNNPLSFLSIDRAETHFALECNPYVDKVYAKAASSLNDRIKNGVYIQEDHECLYLYELIMNGRSQTGIVGCASVDDYLNGIIKKHEHTRPEKEIDRTKHIDVCNAHTGPIFLAYRSNKKLRKLLLTEKQNLPIYDFTTDDEIRHIVYRISNPTTIQYIQSFFSEMDCAYIADGHHRAAAAANVAIKRRKEQPNYTGDEEFNYFLSVFFSEEELCIMDYNRVVKDLNGLTTEDFLSQLEEHFVITPLEYVSHPTEKGSFTMLLENKSYLCHVKPELIPNDPVASLDVSLLQNHLLTPVLSINNPREDARIDFVGGIRGLDELVKRCHNDCQAAFAMYPTSLQELFAVADSGLLMPPKSTWFEPKLRSGIFIHKI